MKTVFEQKSLFCLPWAQTILGTILDGKYNFMALDWLTRVNANPPMIGVCVNTNNISHKSVIEKGEFSINVPSVEMVELTDYTGMVSAKRVDKSELFNVFHGTLGNAPMIMECPVAMECRLNNTVELPTNYFFIADIVNIYIEEACLDNGKPDMKKINPFVLTMPDNNYWSLGDCVGKAWSAGKNHR